MRPEVPSPSPTSNAPRTGLPLTCTLTDLAAFLWSQLAFLRCALFEIGSFPLLILNLTKAKPSEANSEKMMGALASLLQRQSVVNFDRDLVVLHTMLVADSIAPLPIQHCTSQVGSPDYPLRETTLRQAEVCEYNSASEWEGDDLIWRLH